MVALRKLVILHHGQYNVEYNELICIKEAGELSNLSVTWENDLGAMKIVWDKICSAENIDDIEILRRVYGSGDPFQSVSYLQTIAVDKIHQYPMQIHSFI